MISYSFIGLLSKEVSPSSFESYPYFIPKPGCSGIVVVLLGSAPHNFTCFTENTKTELVHAELLLQRYRNDTLISGRG